MPAVKRTELEVFSGGGKIAKNRAKQPGIIPFAAYSTGLKTDPGAFRFCQIQRISPLVTNAATTPAKRLPLPVRAAVECTPRPQPAHQTTITAGCGCHNTPRSTNHHAAAIPNSTAKAPPPPETCEQSSATAYRPPPPRDRQPRRRRHTEERGRNRRMGSSR